MMKKWITATLLLLPLFFALLLYVIFQMTDPATIGPGGILGVFALIYAGCLSLTFVVLRFGLSLAARIIAKRQIITEHPGAITLSARKAYYVASVVAFIPVTLLALHAFSKIQLPDVLLVLLFAGIVVFYIVKRR